MQLMQTVWLKKKDSMFFIFYISLVVILFIKTSLVFKKLLTNFLRQLLG
jgi:hypothetical protein